MSDLYPIKFKPIYLDKIWGGDKIRTKLNKDFGDLPNCGESWELSGVEGSVSVASNGFLKGNNLQELVEIYMGDLVGDKVYDKFGDEFPLLIKFIDAKDDLSIQVHPDDKLSKERHNAYGKTEIWYVLDADKGAALNSGFSKQVDKEKYVQALESGKLNDILSFQEVAQGDVFFIPAGRVHAIGKGIMLAEIQQTSDVTYRIYDYGRKDDKGNERELHTELALDAINYEVLEDYKTTYEAVPNASTEIVDCKYFTTNILELGKNIEKDYFKLDSFVIYMCIEGGMTIDYDGGTETVVKGETILLPASFNTVQLKPNEGVAKILEVFIK